MPCRVSCIIFHGHFFLCPLRVHRSNPSPDGDENSSQRTTVIPNLRASRAARCQRCISSFCFRVFSFCRIRNLKDFEKREYLKFGTYKFWQKERETENERKNNDFYFKINKRTFYGNSKKQLMYHIIYRNILKLNMRNLRGNTWESFLLKRYKTTQLEILYKHMVVRLIGFNVALSYMISIWSNIYNFKLWIIAQTLKAYTQC